MNSKKALIFGLFLILGMTAGAPATAEAMPAGFEVETIASGLNLPGSMAFSQDGRIFIGEKSGDVRVVKNGALLPTPVISLTDVNSYADRGLLSIALDPNFSANGYLYILYTHENTPGANFAGPKTGRLIRVTVVGDTADESTKVIILGTVGGDLANPSCENYLVNSDCIPSDSPSHSTGGLRFGSDGKLYVTLGDGAHFDYVDPRAMRAQNLDSLAGKVLRINPDGTGVVGNPFYTGNPNDNRSKVYARGMRNAFRLNFRPSNGSLFAGDVGWGTWEEVDKIVPGGNYGWPCREGNFQTTGYNCDVTPHNDPTYVYGHDVNGAGAVVAGAFATAYPAQYANSFFIGDYAQNWMKIVNLDANDNFVSVQDFMTAADGVMGPVAIERGPDGNIYYIAIYTGELRRIVYTTGNRQPIAQISATPSNGLAPLTVNFSSTGSSDPDGDALSFSWNFGDGAASTLANPQHTYTANGTYTAVLNVMDGRGGLSTKSTSIAVGNRAPTAGINSPQNGYLYTIGETINLSGFATDPEEGFITNVNQFTWTIILHHNTHIHILETHTGPNASFVAPDHAGAADIYTEVQLTVTDAGGLTNTKSINLYVDNNSASGNLIQNNSFENAIPGIPDSPQNWQRGFWGTNGPVFTYPESGFDGASAAKISMISYTDGDAKWFHDAVSADPNTTYTFAGYYKSSVPVLLIAQFGLGNGNYSYPTLAELPAAADWTRVERTFVTPANTQTAVVAILINQIGDVTVDNFSLVEGTTVGDTTAPIVQLTAPTSGATLSGTSTLSATSSDASGLTEVKFLVDGNVVNTVPILADTKSPFTYAWNTASVTNGAHTITATSRDTAGNIATATPVTVTVSNTTGTTTGANLIANPSVETAGVNGFPANWFKGGSGTNTRTLTHLASGGSDGVRAVRTEITSYTSGDAKWYFQQIPVKGGEQYTFSDRYMSNTTSHVTLYYQLQDGTFRYPDIALNLPASATWTGVTRTFTVPTNYPSPVVSVSVFHLIKSVGWLNTDAYELRKISSSTTPGDTTAPTVSVTSPTANQTVNNTLSLTANASDTSGIASVRFFVDNVLVGTEDTTAPYSVSLDTKTLTNGNHTVIATARDTVGNNATSTGVVMNVQNTIATTSQNLIANGSFENGTTGNPTNWRRGAWGTNTTIYNYPIVGRDGSKAAQVNVTAYTDGDIKWYPDEIPMEDGKVYTFSSWYKSNTISDVIGRYTMSDGSYHYFGVIKEIQPTANWTFFSSSFIPPDDAVSFTPLHLISSIGYLDTDDVSLTVTGTGTSTNDTSAPVVQILTPANGATVNGVVNVTSSSTDNIGTTYVMYAVDGIPKTGQEITQAPYSWTFNTTEYSNGTHTLKATTHDAAGNNSTHTITVTINNVAGGDTTAPTVSLSTPVNNGVVSGTTTINVQAADNVAVAGTDITINDSTLLPSHEIFLIDNTNPYSFVWDSKTVPNGTYTVWASAYDAAGNIATTTPITFQVQNSTTTVPTNLIGNASLETGSAAPTDWSQGNWGANTTVFTYPVAGSEGAKAAKVAMTSYTDGDAKWFFNPVTVTSGTSYTYSNFYQSTVPTTLTARYTLAGGGFAYGDIMTVPASAAWQKAESIIVTPANAVAFTLFHRLNAVGELSVDQYSLVKN